MLRERFANTRLTQLARLLRDICGIDIRDDASSRLLPLHSLALFPPSESEPLSADGYLASHEPRAPLAVVLSPRMANQQSVDVVYRRRLLVSGSVEYAKGGVPPLHSESLLTQQTRIGQQRTIRGTPFVWTSRAVSLEHGIKDVSSQPYLIDNRVLAYPFVGSVGRENTHQDSIPTFVNNIELLPRHSVSVTESFQYSAITYNSHLIHYNKEYALREGYKDVVVPGTLLATLAGAYVQKDLNRFAKGDTVVDLFRYSLARPVYVGEEFVVRLDGLLDEEGRGRVWIEDAREGKLVLSAQFRIAKQQQPNT
ncbi:hypothetical protein HDU83_001592 [Entophlyctis luteolus]|nr:hypothetical protein HDU83_001592 [Entophlyctis luteolus]